MTDQAEPDSFQPPVWTKRRRTRSYQPRGRTTDQLRLPSDAVEADTASDGDHTDETGPPDQAE